MPAFNYGRPKATADRLIARYGQAGKLLKYTKAGTAYAPTVTWPEHDCTFAVVDFSDREIDGSRVLATDKRILLAKGALTVEPTPTDKLKIGGVDHQIIGPEGRGVKTIAPGGVVVVWELQCRL